MTEQGVLIPYGQTQETSDDHYTPREIFDALGLTFDLDVCAPPGGVEWVPALRYFTKEEDGLSQPWTGRVWMNPPYSRARPWAERFMAHRNGIALVAVSKASWWPTLWADCDAMAIPPREILFVNGAVRNDIYMPVCFAAFGDECVEALSRVGIVRVRLSPRPQER